MTAPLLKDPVVQVESAIRLSRGGDTAGGLAMARAAHAAARAAKLPDGKLLRILNVLAMCQASHGHFIEAIADAVDAHAMAEHAGDELSRLHAMTTIAGASAFIHPDQSGVLPLLEGCLARALAIHDTELEWRIRLLRGMRLGSNGRFDDASREFDRCLAISNWDPSLLTVPMVKINFAVLALKRAAAEERIESHWGWAIDTTEHCIRLAERERNIAVLSRAHYNLADIHVRRGNLEAAGRGFAECAGIARAHRQQDQLVNAMIEQGKLAARGDDDGAAVAALEAAYAEADKHRPSRHCATAATLLADLHDKFHQPDARRWRERARQDDASFKMECRHARAQLEAFWGSIVLPRG